MKSNILLFLVFFFIAKDADSKEFTFQYQRIIETTGEINLEVNYVNGSLLVKRTDGPYLVIDGIKKVNASNREEAEEVADHIEIAINKSKNNIKVKTNYLRMLNRSQSFWKKLLGFGGDSYGDIDFVISVPDRCNLTIFGQSGNIEISGMEGTVKVTSASSGKIIISDNIGTVYVNTESADILLSSIEGLIDVKNSQGNSKAEFIFGPVTIRQTLGKIELHWVEGDIKVKTKSAKIDIKQLKGSIDLVAGSGQVDIETEMVTSNSYYIETTTGQISFHIPYSASGLVNIETLSGEIKSEIPISVKSMNRHRLLGEFGNGGTKIVLTSSTGDVSIAQY